MSKYKSRKVTIDGITFDSKIESERYISQLPQIVGDKADLKATPPHLAFYDISSFFSPYEIFRIIIASQI